MVGRHEAPHQGKSPGAPKPSSTGNGPGRGTRANGRPGRGWEPDGARRPAGGRGPGVAGDDGRRRRPARSPNPQTPCAERTRGLSGTTTKEVATEPLDPTSQSKRTSTDARENDQDCRVTMCGVHCAKKDGVSGEQPCPGRSLLKRINQ